MMTEVCNTTQLVSRLSKFISPVRSAPILPMSIHLYLCLYLFLFLAPPSTGEEKEQSLHIYDHQEVGFLYVLL